MGIANIEWQISAKDERSGSQKSEDRSRESEVKRQESEARSQKKQDGRSILQHLAIKKSHDRRFGAGKSPFFRG